MNDVAARLEYLRGEIEAQRISMSEVAELQSLAAHIDDGDVELLEWAGVPEEVLRYRTQAARDAVRIYPVGYADYIEQHTLELIERGRLPESALTQSLSEALMGNNGD